MHGLWRPRRAKPSTVDIFIDIFLIIFDNISIVATKALQAKVIIDAPEKLQYLWLTHKIFNETLPFVIGHVFKMKRGELGEDYKIIYDAIKNNKDFGKLEPITTTKCWNTEKEEKWAEKALAINRSGKGLFDRYKVLPAGSEFWRKLFEMTIQLIHGSEELKNLWDDEHTKWLDEKENWIKENTEFMEVLPLFVEFESKEGKITRRRERWHRYLDFLRSNAKLPTWRNGKSKLKDFTKDEETELREKHFRKPGKILEKFFENNPELKALDRKYKEYLEFTRPWAKRKYKDGFKHPPTFTMPSSVKHPAWYSFKKSAQATYKSLNIAAGTVELKVLTDDITSKGLKGEWKTFSFRADPRLLKFLSKEREGKGKKATSLSYEDKNMGIKRNAEIRGIKLVFKNSKYDERTKNFKIGTPYFIFTCDIADIKGRLSMMQKKIDAPKYKGGWDWVRKQAQKEVDDLVTCAIDLGIRNLGVATIRKGNDILKTNFLNVEGVTLGHIAGHKRQLRRGRSERGKPIKGEESFIELQTHVTNMGEDRFKKGAHEIVSFACKNKADLIVLENLKGFKANATYEKGINKALAAWNRGHLVKWIKQLAQEYGMRVVEVDSFYSSRVCSKCGAPGARYNYINGIPEYEWVGKLFACYECGYRANADFNASVNLHKIFYREFKRDGLTYTGKESVFNGKKYIHEKVFDDLKKGWNKDTPPEMRTVEETY